jgi:hypothetical protein
MLFTVILPISPCFTCSRSLSLYRDQSFNTLSGSGHRGADMVEKDIITSITSSLIGRAVILVIVSRHFVIGNVISCLNSSEIFNQDSGGHYL